MKCPDCENAYVCPCQSCVRFKQSAKPWIRADDNSEACPQCGVVRSLDELLDIEYKLYKEQSK